MTCLELLGAECDASANVLLLPLRIGGEGVLNAKDKNH